MAFDSLSERLQSTLKKVSGQGQLTESNMEEMLTEIRLALLEADVNKRKSNGGRCCRFVKTRTSFS